MTTIILIVVAAIYSTIGCAVYDFTNRNLENDNIDKTVLAIIAALWPIVAVLVALATIITIIRK